MKVPKKFTEDGWVVICDTPLNISNPEWESEASGYAAEIVLEEYQKNEDKIENKKNKPKKILKKLCKNSWNRLTNGEIKSFIKTLKILDLEIQQSKKMWTKLPQEFHLYFLIHGLNATLKSRILEHFEET